MILILSYFVTITFSACYIININVLLSPCEEFYNLCLNVSGHLQFEKSKTLVFEAYFI